MRHIFDTERTVRTYALYFDGRAQVHESCCTKAVFEVGGKTYEKTLPAGVGYDSGDNRTSAKFKTRGSRSMLFFERTNRGDGSPGVGAIQLMRPLRPGSARSHGPTEVVYRPFKSFLQDSYTSVRWLESANGPQNRQRCAGCNRSNSLGSLIFRV